MDFLGSCKGWLVVYNHPIGSIYHLYTTYILPSRGLYNPYHPLRLNLKNPLMYGVIPFQSDIQTDSKSTLVASLEVLFLRI